MLVCIRILCFDHNNGQMTFKSIKVNFQGHGPADHDPKICGSSEIKQLWNGVGEQKVLFQNKFRFICAKMMG